MKFESRLTRFLAHHPILYSFIAGVGVVLFWRGVWHTTDAIASYISIWRDGCPTTDLVFLLKVCAADNIAFPLDGIISTVLGGLIMLAGGVFVSELLGKEIIISGLRGEKRLTERTEVEVRTETGGIAEVQHNLRTIIRRLDSLEKKVDGKAAGKEAEKR